MISIYFTSFHRLKIFIVLFYFIYPNLFMYTHMTSNKNNNRFRFVGSFMVIYKFNILRHHYYYYIRLYKTLIIFYYVYDQY